jgi:hypothetical protein
MQGSSVGYSLACKESMNLANNLHAGQAKYAAVLLDATFRPRMKWQEVPIACHPSLLSTAVYYARNRVMRLQALAADDQGGTADQL